MPWIQFEISLYWLVFTGGFLGIALWESARPRRPLIMAESRRWRGHAVVFAVGTTFTTLVLQRTPPVAMALLVSGWPHALFNRMSWPPAAKWIITILLLDLVNYAVHRAHHAVPILWRVHQVHHSDPDFDVSTTGRVHPLEFLATHAATLGVVAVLGPPPLVVFLYELVRTFHGLFAHANASPPALVEALLRRVLVTPDMHRIHHSEEGRENRSNFGDVFPWWDHLFRTYVHVPAAGQEGMVAGLRGFQDERSLGVLFMLTLPFRQQVDENDSADAE